MTFRDAQKLIRITQISELEYELECTRCGARKQVGTDAPCDLAIGMAEIHTDCTPRELKIPLEIIAQQEEIAAWRMG